MAGQTIQMDYPSIQNTIKGFRAQSDVVKAVGQVGEMLFQVLEMGAFMCPPLAQYYSQCKDAVKNTTKDLTNELESFATKLEGAIQDHKNGDATGKSYFGAGD